MTSHRESLSKTTPRRGRSRHKAVAMRPTGVGSLAVCGLVLSAWALAACSGPQPSTSTPAPAQTTSPSGTQGESAGRAGAEDTRTSPAHRSPGRASSATPSTSPPSIKHVGYGKPSPKDKAHFAAVSRAGAGLIKSAAVHDLTVAGRDVGAVATYQVARDAARSRTFRDQFLVQALNATTKSNGSPKFLRAGDGVVAVSHADKGAAGSFQEDRLVLVVRERGKADLAGLLLEAGRVLPDATPG